MQAVEQVSPSHFPIKSTSSNISCFCGRTWKVLVGIATLPLIGAAYLAYLALIIIKKVYNTFGQKEAVCNFAYGIRKFKLLYIDYNLLWSEPYGRLVDTTNMIKIAIVTSEEDTKVNLAMRDQFLQKNKLLPPEHLERLKKATCNGADMKGICFGAVKSILKACLQTKIESEEELIEVLSRFKDGFDAEAAGFQKVYNKTQNYVKVISRQCQDLLKKEIDEVKALEIQYTTAEKPVKDSLLAEFTKVFKACRHKLLLAEEPDRVTYYNAISELIGLRILNDPKNVADIFFDDFNKDADVQKRFNECANGMYSICFSTNGSGHAIAYLKFSFGSYFVDPSFGLLSPVPMPSSKLLKLLEYYESELYRFEMYNHATV